MANNLLFSYKLLNDDANRTENTDGLFVSSWGSAAEQDRRYWFEISAKADPSEGSSWDSTSLKLQSIDLTLNFDNKVFSPVSAGDLRINSSLPLFRSAILNDVTADGSSPLQKSIRFAAGSASDVTSGGSGITLSTTTSTQIARILLNVNDAFFKTNTLSGADDTSGSLNNNINLRDESGANPTALKLDQLVSFNINRDETVFGDLQSLRVKGGDAIETANTTTNVLRATQQVDIRGATFNTYAPLRTDLNYGAAAGQKTNLIRSGSKLSRSFDIANVGSSSLMDLEITKEGSLSPATATAKLYASKGTRNWDGSLSYYQGVTEITASNKTLSGGTTLYNSLYVRRDPVGSGSLDQTLLNQDGKNNSGDVLTMRLDVDVIGAAGTALELTNTGGFTVAADGFSKTFTGLNTKNLITYQGDLNYDGKVSFADLAYLNAGAAELKKAVSDRKSITDVDANFDGTIDISDLSILEKDWGKTLHGSDGSFTGSSSFGSNTAEWKASMKTFQTVDTWTNTAFEAENLLSSGSGANAVMAPLDQPSNTSIAGGVNNDGARDDATSLATIANI